MEKLAAAVIVADPNDPRCIETAAGVDQTGHGLK
ncbi:MAG: hypothetical protein V7634_4790 [Bradyrhizobium sp.]|jgi:hypothetical protein